MGQFSKVLLVIDNAHTVLQRALYCRLGLGRLKQGYGPNHLTPISTTKFICVVLNICGQCTWYIDLNSLSFHKIP